MSNLIPCKECGHEISSKAKTCPNCGVAKPAKRPPTPGENLAGLIIVGIIFAGFYFFWPTESPEEREARLLTEAQEEAEERRKGFHCLSAWDGSHRNVVSFVKERLRDPESFEHIKTSITPVDENGEHILFMEYRATNGFGGITVGTATANIKNEGCGGTVTSIE